VRIAQIVFHTFDVIVLLGIIQAVIIAVVLVMRGTGKPPVLLFGTILLTLAGLSVKILLHTAGFWQLPAFRYFPLAIDTLPAPLLYAYLRSATGLPLTRRRLVLYLVPTVLFMSHAILVYLLVLGQPDALLKDPLAEKLLYNPVKDVEDMIAVILAIVFWLMGYRQLRSYRQWLYHSQSDTRFEEYSWLRRLLILSGILALVFCLVTLLEDLLKAGRHDFVVLQIFYVYLAVISYYLSLKGYSLYVTGNLQTAPVVQDQPESVAPVRLSSEQLAIKDKIAASLEKERLYLNPELTLKDLSGHIGCPANVVSAVINHGFGQNFRNLVNSYRVRAVQEMLKAPPAHLSLLGIALDCGFNSEASFYRIFRQFAGLSPNEYQQKINTQNRF